MASFAARARNLKRRIPHSTSDLKDVLSEQRIDELCHAVGHTGRDCFWRPLLVSITFLRQVLLLNGSCRQTVAGAQDWNGGWRVQRRTPARSQKRRKTPVSAPNRVQLRTGQFGPRRDGDSRGVQLKVGWAARVARKPVPADICCLRLGRWPTSAVGGWP